MGERLTDEQINRAYRLFYGDGMMLGQIKEIIGCSIYDLHPWLLEPFKRMLREETARAEAAGSDLRQARSTISSLMKRLKEGWAAPCDGSGEAGETEGLDPKDDSAVDEVEAPDPDLSSLRAENDRLSTALAESERRAITLDDVRGSMWRLQYERRAGDDLWPAILKARDARLAKSATPTQETPNVEG